MADLLALHSIPVGPSNDFFISPRDIRNVVVFVQHDDGSVSALAGESNHDPISLILTDWSLDERRVVLSVDVLRRGAELDHKETPGEMWLEAHFEDAA